MSLQSAEIRALALQKMPRAIYFLHYLRAGSPKTFNEKIRRRKCLDHDPRFPLRADKVLVKDFVAKMLGQEWITPTLWHGPKLPLLEERKWPLPFVLKANNGSGSNLFLRTQRDLRWPEIEIASTKWLSEIFGKRTNEWFYAKIVPQLLIEPFIGNDNSLPTDFKLWTFHGRVEFIQVDTDREHDHKRTMFDRNWKRLPFTTLYPIDDREIAPPKSLNEMMRAAEAIVEDISFARVDFYEIDNKPRFGEITFCPGAGHEPFMPAEANRTVGDLW